MKAVGYGAIIVLLASILLNGLKETGENVNTTFETLSCEMSGAAVCATD